jgi:hypothetical protein
LSTNYVNTFGNSLDDLCESFTNVILQAGDESIPNKIITVRKTGPPWMNGAIRIAIRNGTASKTSGRFFPIYNESLFAIG